MSVKKCFAGLDLGGTNIKAGLIAAAGPVQNETQMPVRLNLGVDSVLDQMAEAIQDLLRNNKSCRLAGAGVGAAGLVDVSRGVLWNAPNLPGWIEVPVACGLEKRLGVPVAMDNDANAAALGEYAFGAGRGARNMLMVTLGTGVGGGLILDGRLFHGSADSAGEIGHTIIQTDGPLCGCGRRGCVEAFAGGNALVRNFRELLAQGHDSILKGLPEKKITPRDIGEAADQGDEPARRVLAKAGKYLGIAIGNAVNLLNLDRVVIGGGVANAGEWILSPAREALNRTALTVPARSVRIVSAQMGEKAGWIGAAYLAQLRRSETKRNSNSFSQ
ncbi:MAG TPA: ROK family protein [bacterium]|nr:ROK family protein [bacterium]